MAHAGTEFILTKTDSFHLRSWTDVYDTYVDGEGNRIWKENKYRGEGIYSQEGDSLYLSFTNNDSLLVRIHYSREELLKTYDISFYNELGNPCYVQYQFEDVNNKILRNEHFPRSNSYTLSFKKEEYPATLKLSGFMLNVEAPIIELNQLQLGINEIKLKTYNGYFAFGDRVIIWFKPTFTGIRYKFRKRKRWLPKKWRLGLLNKLYRDY